MWRHHKFARYQRTFQLEKVRGPSYETELMSEYCEEVFMDLLRPLRTVGMEKNYIHPFESKESALLHWTVLQSCRIFIPALRAVRFSDMF